MYTSFQSHLQNELQAIEQAGLYKNERIIVSPQGAVIRVADGQEVLNFCANNYLGLSNSPELKQAAKDAIDSHGYGVSSVRFICGTQDVHKQLESAIAQFFGTEDTILYAACFDANGGVFEPLLTEQDAIISDALNHASIIDGVRLCKAQRYRYANADMADLEAQLQKAQAQRFRLIVTDGVFSMDGNVAPLDKIYALAEQYDAMIMVDESHSAGVVGDTGRGVTERYNLRGQVEIITGTLGKAFGGAIGGFTTGKKEIIDLLRQRSRPYLFSNSIPPLRSSADRDALRAGVLDGTIDAIVSDHTAVNADAKSLPVGQAQAGAVGTQWLLNSVLHFAQDTRSDIAQALSHSVAKAYAVLGLPAPTWENGAAANFVVFDETAHQPINAEYIIGQHTNTPWLGYELTGRITHVVHHGAVV